MADAYSDLALGLITTNTAYEDFVAKREAFLRWNQVPCSRRRTSSSAFIKSWHRSWHGHTASHTQVFSHT
jgi:hypothetical protein